LKQIQAKLAEAVAQEVVDPYSGVAVGPDGRSLGHLDVAVVSARNLPECKKLTASADPYVELTLLSDDDPRLLTALGASGGGSSGGGSSGGGRAGGYGAAWVDDRDARRFRTSARWGTLFPEWRESLRLPVSLAVPVHRLVLLVRVFDTSKLGETHDEVVALATVPVRTLLSQQLQKTWVTLQPPPVWNPRTRARFNEACAVRLDVKLFYCRRLQLQHRFDTMVESLTAARAMETPAPPPANPAAAYHPAMAATARRPATTPAPAAAHFGPSSTAGGGGGSQRGRGPGTSKAPPARAFITQTPIGQPPSPPRRAPGASAAAPAPSENVPLSVAHYHSLLHAPPPSAAAAAASARRATSPRKAEAPAPAHAKAPPSSSSSSAAAPPARGARKAAQRLLGLRERDHDVMVYDSAMGEVLQAHLGTRLGVFSVPPKRVDERTAEDDRRAKALAAKHGKRSPTAAAAPAPARPSVQANVFDVATYFDRAGKGHTQSRGSSGTGGGGGGGGKVVPVVNRKKRGVAAAVDPSATRGSPERKAAAAGDVSSDDAGSPGKRARQGKGAVQGSPPPVDRAGATLSIFRGSPLSKPHVTTASKREQLRNARSNRL